MDRAINIALSRHRFPDGRSSLRRPSKEAREHLSSRANALSAVHRQAHERRSSLVFGNCDYL
jgi:hypothetical protein